MFRYERFQNPLGPEFWDFLKNAIILGAGNSGRFKKHRKHTKNFAGYSTRNIHMDEALSASAARKYTFPWAVAGGKGENESEHVPHFFWASRGTCAAFPGAAAVKKTEG